VAKIGSDDPVPEPFKSDGCGYSNKRSVEIAAISSHLKATSPCTRTRDAANSPVEQADSHADATGFRSGSKSIGGETSVKDPVCGTTVNPAKNSHHAEHDGQACHVCSADCRASSWSIPPPISVLMDDSTHGSAERDPGPA